MFEFLTNLIFPPRCLFCRAVRSAPGVCPACESAVPKTPADRRYALKGSLCAAPLFYEGHVRDLMHRFKFQGKYALAGPMSEYISHAAGRLPAADLVTWVPVSRRRLRTRGYDQSELLARETAERLRRPLVSSLRKIRDVPTQNKLTDAAARRANVTGAFEVLPGTVEGRRLLLVDDVCTSGATLEECGRILRAAGAESVVCAVFAKTRHALPDAPPACNDHRQRKA